MFIVVDGLDGTGKSVIIDEIVKFHNDKRILDLHEYWKKHNDHPDFSEYEKNKNYVPLDSFDMIISSEPSYIGIGQQVRDEITASNSRDYSAKFTAEMFSADREILYRRVHIPALHAGKTIVQSRCVSTSIVYQPMQGKDSELSIDDILSFSGNKLALEHPPNLLIIPTINNPEELIHRLNSRDKDDNSIFENLEFQLKLKPLYESEFLRNIFESRGTTIKYLDAGVSIESTREQTRKIIKDFYKK